MDIRTAGIAVRHGVPRPAFIIGIDEAGRGPLAGPVVIAGVRIKSKLKNQKSKFFEGIKDSKKLSARQREEWYARITGHPDVQWATAAVWPRTIDRINILQATLRGARRVFKKLNGQSSLLPSRDGRQKMVVRVLLDGGLVLPAGIPQQTIIKGDEKIPVIAAASVIAKVTRDRLMLRLHKEYPHYRFDLHKGYGTAFHREMIRVHGRSPLHRASFRWE